LSRPNGRDKKEASSVGNDVVKDGDLEVPVGRKANVSLLDQHSELKKQAEALRESAFEKQVREEEKILESVAERTGE
jgi:ATP-dependent RNA helicase DDX41